MLVEQLSGQIFQIDMRKFEDDEEHRSYRCDQKLFFRMAVNPEGVDYSVIDTTVEATIQQGELIFSIYFIQRPVIEATLDLPVKEVRLLVQDAEKSRQS